jgi:cell shape-determining protein MreC
MERGNDMENIHYPALLGLLEELLERVEQLEKDNQILKSYAWEQ